MVFLQLQTMNGEGKNCICVCVCVCVCGIRKKRAGTGSIVGVDGYGTVMVKNGNENILDEKRKNQTWKDYGGNGSDGVS